VPFWAYKSLFVYPTGFLQIQPMSVYHNRLMAMREQMQIRATLQGPEIYGYILPSTDEHLNQEVAARDQRLRYLSGFSGVRAFAAVTSHGAAIWVENRDAGVSHLGEYIPHYIVKVASHGRLTSVGNLSRHRDALDAISGPLVWPLINKHNEFGY